MWLSSRLNASEARLAWLCHQLILCMHLSWAHKCKHLSQTTTRWNCWLILLLDFDGNPWKWVAELYLVALLFVINLIESLHVSRYVVVDSVFYSSQSRPIQLLVLSCHSLASWVEKYEVLAIPTEKTFVLGTSPDLNCQNERSRSFWQWSWRPAPATDEVYKISD